MLVETGWDNPNKALAELHEPEFKRFVEILKSDPKPDRGLRTLLARLEELGDYGFFHLGELRESLWESDQLIVIRIHTTRNGKETYRSAEFSIPITIFGQSGSSGTLPLARCLSNVFLAVSSAGTCA